jgi:hypothetical protein
MEILSGFAKLKRIYLCSKVVGSKCVGFLRVEEPHFSVSVEFHKLKLLELSKITSGLSLTWIFRYNLSL